MMQQVGGGGGGYLYIRDGTAVAAAPEAIHLTSAKIVQLRRRLLKGMDAESGQEPRQASKPGAGRAEPQKQIPVHCKLKAFVELAAH
jgi:hypothetical protein